MANGIFFGIDLGFGTDGAGMVEIDLQKAREEQQHHERFQRMKNSAVDVEFEEL